MCLWIKISLYKTLFSCRIRGDKKKIVKFKFNVFWLEHSLVAASWYWAYSRGENALNSFIMFLRGPKK